MCFRLKCEAPNVKTINIAGYKTYASALCLSALHLITHSFHYASTSQWKCWSITKTFIESWQLDWLVCCAVASRFLNTHRRVVNYGKISQAWPHRAYHSCAAEAGRVTHASLHLYVALAPITSRERWWRTDGLVTGVMMVAVRVLTRLCPLRLLQISWLQSCTCSTALPLYFSMCSYEWWHVLWQGWHFSALLGDA